MLQIRRSETDRLLELGGGANPTVVPTCRGGRDVAVDVRMCYDAENKPTVDFTCDFEEILPIASDEFDGVVSVFCIEHISWRKLPQFVSEMYRVCKPGGKVIVISPNTEAQIEWAKNNPNGWDGKDLFESASCVLFGDQDYSDNTHKSFLTPAIAMQLFQKAGFENILIGPYGARDTDMSIIGERPKRKHAELASTQGNAAGAILDAANTMSNLTREEMYDKHYFHGGAKVGGYAREGYWDYPVHNVTAAHILLRKPKSVLEVGCARGYILKRIQDAGIPGVGLEISKHCYLTRVCDGVVNHDTCNVPWFDDMSGMLFYIGGDGYADLCYSLAVLEHIPEEFIPAIIKEMARTCERGLHGIDFGHNDDGFDKTHVCLKSKEWWEMMFHLHAPGWPVEIVDKEELERGSQPFEMSLNDNLVKLNIGCYINQFHHNWINLDVHDLNQFAQQHGYRYQQCDVKNGLPFATGSVDMVYSSHMFEHLSYDEGLAFLRECRRVIKPNGLMRFLVPDAEKLIARYYDTNNENGFDELAEISDGVEKAPTALRKLWELLMSGHHAMYDGETLIHAMRSAGFKCRETDFRETQIGSIHGDKMLKETMDMLPCISLIVEAIPDVV